MLARVHDRVTNGWKDTNTYEMLKPFYSRRNEITLYQRCLLWGMYVIVPVKLRTQILNLLHESQKNQNMPAIALLHPWEWPSSPWERVHIEFAGPFLDRMFFVLVDAHSKWPEIVEMKTTTSTKTIEVLRSIFSRNGIPAQIVSDNGSQFSSDEFATFMKRNGIKHFKSAPHHPATNGLTEQFIQTFKNSMRAMKDENRDINQKIANFLIMVPQHPPFHNK